MRELPARRELTGRLAEFDELRAHLNERPRLLVVQSAPRSGATSLLALLDDDESNPLLRVDARRCRDQLDLAMSIADEAVARFAAPALRYWQDPHAHPDGAGLRLARTLAEAGVDLDGLRLGSGDASSRMVEALRLTAHLADGPVTVAVDHLSELLAGQAAEDTRRLLADLRAAAQERGGPALVLVDAWDGQVARSLGDEQAPLYRAGLSLTIARPTPDRFVSDLAITRPWVPASITGPILHGLAGVAGGSPGLVWRLAELVDRGAVNAPMPTLVADAWQLLLDLSEPELATQWALLRRAHPHAVTAVSALAAGIAPNAALPNSKTARDALGRLRGLGIVWQPRPRVWRLADPLLASYARRHAAPWLSRRLTA